MFQFEEKRLLSELSTFGIGGPARYFIEVETLELLQEVIRYCYEEKLPYIIIGKGSNSLFDDKGFDGLAILNKIHFCQFHQQEISVGSGYPFSLLGTQSARQFLTGLEFACGIPGTVGGAIYMNAGAQGGEVAEVLSEVSFVSEEGELQIFNRSDLRFSYRTSSFQGKKGAIAAARFILKPSKGARQKQITLIQQRTRTQPYKDKSCGCVFRNPRGASAGALIEACGLKGKSIGGAEISLLHANFIVNKGGALAKEVLELATLVKETVKKQTGVDLEMELCHVPYLSS